MGNAPAYIAPSFLLLALGHVRMILKKNDTARPRPRSGICYKIVIPGPTAIANLESAIGNYLASFTPFLPATVLRGPLRVRALVRVRWPRTGRFRRWRKPR